MAGLFITFEGGDGAGKTTQSELLAAWLQGRGYEVVHTREPGGSSLGDSVRNVLLHGGHVYERAEALLYAADRAQNIAEIVRPALERGAAVVQDRYIDSSLAYQGAGRPMPQDEIRRLNEWASEGLWPALTVLLDVNPETAISRRKAAGQKADRLEREAAAFHQRVREEYLKLAAAEPERFLVLDASLPIDKLHALIVARATSLVEA